MILLLFIYITVIYNEPFIFDLYLTVSSFIDILAIIVLLVNKTFTIPNYLRSFIVSFLWPLLLLTASYGAIKVIKKVLHYQKAVKYNSLNENHKP